MPRLANQSILVICMIIMLFYAFVSDPLGSGHHEGVRRERLSSLDQTTGGQEVQRRKKKKKTTKLQRQSTLIRREVESLPTFWPVFIILLSIGQVS